MYLEQVMQVASVLAGFSLGQADLLRRAMGKKKHDVLAAQRDSFINGAVKKGIGANLAAEVFTLMEHFADYGFNKSHSAAYALVAYQTAYLKAHYPQEFMAALLTSIMGANDKVGFYIEECRRMGIPVLAPDINSSQASFSVDGDGIRFGLAGVKNVGENAIEALIEARKNEGRFNSIVDFCTKVDMRVVNKRVIESLIKCGAFDSLKVKRSQLLAVLDQAVDTAQLRQREKASGQIGLFGEETMIVAEDINLPQLPEIPKEQRLAMEKEMTGFYVTGHPLDKFREKLNSYSNINELLANNQADGKLVRAAGLITNAKRITTKSGDMMCFITIEDFSNQIEVVVFPRLFEKINRILVPDTPVAVSGRLNINEDRANIVAESMKRLDEPSEVRIKLGRDQETDIIFSNLKEIFASFRGTAVVFIHLVDSRRVIKTEKRYWIDPSSEAICKIEALLGNGTVQVI